MAGAAATHTIGSPLQPRGEEGGLAAGRGPGWRGIRQRGAGILGLCPSHERRGLAARGASESAQPVAQQASKRRYVVG